MISYRGTLTLENCEFIHFFHDYTSLIGIEQGYGKVEITDCSFTKFSNCASIIRDTKDYPETSLLVKSSETVSDTLLRAARASILLQQADDVPIPCTSSDCASIMISGCTFTDFNYLKTALPDYQNLYMSDSVMKYQGIILSLSSFYGEISVSDSSFTGITFKYPHCNPADHTDSNIETTPWNTQFVQQAKALIRVELHNNVFIYKNEFTGCNSHSGLLFLERTGNDHVIIIKDNTFTQNTALGVANLIRLDLATPVAYTDSLTDHIPCSAVLICKYISNQK